MHRVLKLNNNVESYIIQKRQPETDFIDPLMSKKPRISHLNNRGPPTSSGRQPSEDKKPTPPVTAACPGPSFHPASGSSSNSPSTPEGRGSQDLPLDQSSICGNSAESYAPRSHTPSPASQPGSTTSPSPSFSTCTVSTTTVTSTTTSSRTLSTSASPTGSQDGKDTKKPKKSKKHKDKERNREGGKEKDKERKREREQRKEDHCNKEAQPRKKHRNEAEQKHIPANISREPDAGLCAL